MTRRRIHLIPVLTLLLLSSVSWAVDKVNFSGFMTVGVAVSDNKEEYLNERYVDVASYSSETIFGLQIDSRLSDQARLSAQLVATERSSFEAEAEWLYLSYNLSPSLTARAGRLRLPIYSVSSYVQVSSSYLWLSPPETVYGQVPFNRYNGIDLHYRTSVDETTYGVKLIIGNIKDAVRVFGLTQEATSKNLHGVRFSTETEFYKAHVLYLNADASFDGLEIKTQFISAGLTLAYGQWETIIETARTDTDTSLLGVVDGAFVTQSRSCGDWASYITLGVIGSNEVTDNFNKDASNVTIGAKYQDDNNLTWKAELHHGKAKDNRQGLFSIGVGLIPQDPTVNLVRLSVSTIF